DALGFALAGSLFWPVACAHATSAESPSSRTSPSTETIFLISLSLDFSPTLHEPLTADSPCQPETPTYSDVPVHPTAFCKKRVSSGRCVGPFYSSGVNTPRNRLRMIKLGFRVREQKHSELGLVSSAGCHRPDSRNDVLSLAAFLVSRSLANDFALAARVVAGHSAARLRRHAGSHHRSHCTRL